jgi:hypothetical protein
MINKRTWSIYGAVALFHGVMICFYQVPLHDPAKAKRTLPTSSVVMAAGTSWDPIIKTHPLVRNPLLMAQANERGFTSDLWNKSFENQNPYSDWGESYRYLEHPQTDWGHSFLHFSDRLSENLWKPIDKPGAELNEALPPNPFAQAQTQLQFGQNLQNRLPDSLPELPAWTGSEPLEPTRLQLGIDPLGLVQSVRLENPSAWNQNEQDFVQQAIRKIKTMMFQRDPNWNEASPGPLEWGDVEIQWLRQTTRPVIQPQPEGGVR